MAAPSSNLRERVSFELNRPLEVTVESPGVQQNARDGAKEYRYFLAGRRVMWVGEAVHDAIENAGPLPLTFEITHRKSGRAAATWEVVHLVDEPDSSQAAPAARPRAASQPPAASQPVPRELAPPFGGMPGGLPDPREATDVGNTSLYTCMCAAIRVAAAAEKFSQQIGRPMAFETSDVRAMAAALFIHGKGRR
jgi:hypothetical protein